MLKNKKHKKHNKSKRTKGIKIRFLVILWGIVLVVMITVALILQFTANDLKTTTTSMISSLVAFASFIATSFFSISIYNHNAIIREMNTEIRNQSDEVNARGEAFRTLQFIASNYTIVDFVDYMLIYPESERYIKKLRDTKEFNFYLAEQDVDMSQVLDNMDDYRFLTAKIPINIIEGKTIGKIVFTRFKFEKDDGVHRFVPTNGVSSTALIIHNENDKRGEAIINLVMHKKSEFFTVGELNPFLKIKINLSMESLLGVIVKGTMELYFTNPEKLEASGANRYKINSSQFESSGMPRLTSDYLGQD